MNQKCFELSTGYRDQRVPVGCVATILTLFTVVMMRVATHPVAAFHRLFGRSHSAAIEPISCESDCERQRKKPVNVARRKHLIRRLTSTTITAASCVLRRLARQTAKSIDKVCKILVSFVPPHGDIKPHGCCFFEPVCRDWVL
jgi:hypothetical protein